LWREREGGSKKRKGKKREKGKKRKGREWGKTIIV